MRRVAAVNDRTIVVVNAGMPVLMPWADQVAAVGYAWLPGQAMGAALADVLLGRAEPGGRLPVTIPAAEADCPVLHAVPDDGPARVPGGPADRLPRVRPRRDEAALRVRPRPGLHDVGVRVGGGGRAGASAPDGDLGVTVVLRNTGPRTGREVVQAYVEPPAGDPAAQQHA